MNVVLIFQICLLLKHSFLIYLHNGISRYTLFRFVDLQFFQVDKKPRKTFSLTLKVL